MVLDFLKNTFFPGAEFIERYNMTFIAAYVLSMIISFFLNTFITFREKPTWNKFIRFPIGYIPNFVVQYLTVAVFVWLGGSRAVAYVVAAVIGVPVTFLTMKYVVYKNRE